MEKYWIIGKRHIKSWPVKYTSVCGKKIDTIAKANELVCHQCIRAIKRHLEEEGK